MLSWSSERKNMKLQNHYCVELKQIMHERCTSVVSSDSYCTHMQTIIRSFRILAFTKTKNSFVFHSLRIRVWKQVGRREKSGASAGNFTISRGHLCFFSILFQVQDCPKSHGRRDENSHKNRNPRTEFWLKFNVLNCIAVLEMRGFPDENNIRFAV